MVRPGGTEALTLAFGLVDRVRRRGELPVAVGVDVEPDERGSAPGEPGEWSGFIEMASLMPTIRGRLSQATGSPAAFSWFLRMDPQIDRTWGSSSWVVDQWGAELVVLEREGDELGLHTHDWRWSEELGEWTMINEDPDWESHVVTSSIEAFRETLGTVPRAHRGGDHMLTPAMLEALAMGGIEIDLTVEPGLAPKGAARDSEHALGRSADYRLAPSAPYRASAESFPAPGPSGMSAPLLLPLASAPTRRGGRAPLTLWSEPRAFAARLALAMLRSPPPMLVFALRSDIVFRTQWPSVLANLELLAGRPGVRFVTASEAAAPFLA